MSYDIQDIKSRAVGRWSEIFESLAGLDRTILDGKHHPCPKCDGKDRFRAIEISVGGLFCNKCQKSKCGDGIAAVKWLLGCDLKTSIAKIGDYLGIGNSGMPRNIIDDFCRKKCIQKETLLKFGATKEKRGSQPVVRVPMVKWNGKKESYSESSPYSKKKLSKGMLPKGGKAGLFLTGTTTDGEWSPKVPLPGEKWLLTEGFKDASVLVDLGFNAAGINGNTISNSCEKLFKGCDVILVPDLDRGSMAGFHTTAKKLEGHAKSLSVCIFAGIVKPTNGDGVRESVKALGADAVKSAIESACPFDESIFLSRPRININVTAAEEAEVADRVIEAMAKQGFSNEKERFRIYQRGGLLVEVFNTDFGPKIGTIGRAGIRERIGAAVDLIEIDPNGDDSDDGKIKRPPAWLTDAIIERREYESVKKLDAVVASPTIMPDGSVLQDAGYCSKCRLLLVPDGVYPRIPEEPTREEVAQAVEELLEVVSDFPFKDDTAKSVWLSLVLTLIGRAAIEGNTPLFAFSANIRGSGKTKLCDLASLIAYGSQLGKQSLPPKPIELEKILTATAMEGANALLFDNVTISVGNSEFDKALTSGVWSGRILSKSEIFIAPWRTVLMATGNNISFAADTARRVVLCDLMSQEERPEYRSGFKFQNVEKHVSENRHRLASLALLILKAYAVSKTSPSGVFGSFEDWSRWIVGAVEFAGLESPMAAKMDIEASDDNRAALSLLLSGLKETGYKSSRQILDGILSVNDDDNGWQKVREAIESITSKQTSRTIGAQLKKFKNRVINGQQLVTEDGRAGLKLWGVQEVSASTSPEPDNVETCCGQPLQHSDTPDGFVNRNCGICGENFRCIPK